MYLFVWMREGLTTNRQGGFCYCQQRDRLFLCVAAYIGEMKQRGAIHFVCISTCRLAV